MYGCQSGRRTEPEEWKAREGARSCAPRGEREAGPLGPDRVLDSNSLSRTGMKFDISCSGPYPPVELARLKALSQRDHIQIPYVRKPRQKRETSYIQFEGSGLDCLP